CHMLPACQGIHCPQIRFDHGTRPCPTIRRTAKQEMVDFFEAKQTAAREGEGQALTPIEVAIARRDGAESKPEPEAMA
ncbi:MAG: hypothetical protein ACREP7_11565, partial [Lysobacter sp.]